MLFDSFNLTGRAINEDKHPSKNDSLYNGLNSENNSQYIELDFYDKNTNCSLNGEVYGNGIYLGNSQNGTFYLSLADYIRIINNSNNHSQTIFNVKGRTDYCFDLMDFVFDKSWIVNTNLTPYFNYEQKIFFEANYNPRYPSSYGEMQGFIRPNETSFYLSRLKISSGETLENIEKISKFNLNYLDDSINFNTNEYWQTPYETLIRQSGDCEDWGVTVLSLIKNYDINLKCYNALWQNHLSVFCYYNNHYILLDQKKTKKEAVIYRNKNDSASIQGNKIELRNLLSSYFKDYGLNANENKIEALINEKEIVLFKSNEEFINWALSLRD